jgi:predicted GNAT superfamily acetyltransferase
MFVPHRHHPPLTCNAPRVNQDAARRASATPSATPVLDAEHSEISIRPVASLAEFRACVGLQAEVWGPEYTDSVPASLLQVATYVGGLVLGAFTANDELVGFLFGLTGIDGAEIVHWSHLLGVRDSARNAGVGRLLKEAQRAELARRGVQRMSWTFDPLVAKNAYLNLNRLGARVVEYVPNMYGTTTSPLHYGVATDRLVVSVDTHATAPQGLAFDQAPARLPVLTPARQDGDMEPDLVTPPPALWIEIPGDIRQVIERSPASVMAWRESVREHFQWALSNGYSVAGLQREPVTSRSFYLLQRDVA